MQNLEKRGKKQNFPERKSKYLNYRWYGLEITFNRLSKDFLNLVLEFISLPIGFDR